MEVLGSCCARAAASAQPFEPVCGAAAGVPLAPWPAAGVHGAELLLPDRLVVESGEGAGFLGAIWDERVSGADDAECTAMKPAKLMQEMLRSARACRHRWVECDTIRRPGSPHHTTPHRLMHGSN